MTTIKNHLIIILALVLSSSRCPAQSANQLIAPDIVNQIAEHYYQVYKYSIIKRETSDSMVTISVNYDEPYDKSLASTFLVVYITKRKQDYLIADINSDGSLEIVVSIIYESGVSSPIKGNDIFLFRPTGDTFNMIFVKNSSLVSGCGAGFFYPEKLKPNLIKGRSVCWDDNDSHCCPALHYQTTVKFENDKLYFVEKTLEIQR